MSTPVPNLQITIKTMADVAVGSPVLTGSAGESVSVNLPPGEYKVIIEPLTGYTLDETTLVENGGSPITGNVLTVLNITITSSDTTSLVANFLET